jgi:pimeloyl-ACP methyl ester carboxylesterase
VGCRVARGEDGGLSMPVGIVLVHGAFHGPWCWDKVVARLRSDGFDVATPDLYRGPFPADPALVQADVDRLGAQGPVVVCGHSFGGYPITALDPATVAHLVYLAAFLPDRETWFPDLPVAPSFMDMVTWHDDGTSTVKPERARELFYADCTDDDAAWAIGNLRNHSMEGASAVLERPAWREVPSTYVSCDDDNTLTQHYMAQAIERVGDGVRWPTSHSPMISRPELVTDLLTGLAARYGS